MQTASFFTAAWYITKIFTVLNAPNVYIARATCFAIHRTNGKSKQNCNELTVLIKEKIYNLPFSVLPEFLGICRSFTDT
jgi:hypothetical protein